MTAIIHHGPPGSFKSFAIVQRVVIPALQEGRVVVTNIRGLTCIDLICETMNITIPESAELINVEHSETGFAHMAKFFSWAPVGALIVMDECQQVYPARLKTLAGFDTSDLEQASLIESDKLDNPELEEPRPNRVEIAFEKHRHMGWDIYMSTPHISKVNKEVKQVCQYAKRHRDLSGVLPWFKNTWREYLHDPENSGKSKSHELETPRRYKADVRVFNCYKSTGIGTPKGSNEKISIFSDNRVRVFIFIIICSISTFFYLLAQTIENFSNTAQVANEESSSLSFDVPNNDGGSNGNKIVSSNDGSLKVLAVPDQEQFTFDLIGKSKIYYVGTFKYHHFNVISKEGVLNLTSVDFESVGYSIEQLSRCIFKLTNGRHINIATCSPTPEHDDRGSKGIGSGSSLLSSN